MIQGELKKRIDAKKWEDEDRDEFGYSLDEEDVIDVLDEVKKEFLDALMKEAEHNGNIWAVYEKWFGES